jgi:flagellar basal body rod protein FlgB
MYRQPTQPSADGNTVEMDVERAQFAENAFFYEAGHDLPHRQDQNHDDGAAGAIAMSMFNTFHVAGSALTAQSLRLNAVASNLANADSVVGSDGKPYRAKQVVFAATPMGNAAAQGVRVKQVVEDSSPGRLVYDPRNPAARRARLRRRCPTSAWSTK